MQTVIKSKVIHICTILYHRWCQQALKVYVLVSHRRVPASPQGSAGSEKRAHSSGQEEALPPRAQL